MVVVVVVVVVVVDRGGGLMPEVLHVGPLRAHAIGRDVLRSNGCGINLGTELSSILISLHQFAIIFLNMLSAGRGVVLLRVTNENLSVHVRT